MDFTILPEPKHSKLQNAFSALEEKIAFQKKHISLTENSYHDDFQSKKKIVDKEFSESVEHVQKNYDEAFDHATGSEHERDQIAEYESGKQNMHDYFKNQHEMLEDDLNEILDHFNKSSLIMFYALVESEIKRLCFLMQEEMGKKISIEDFKSVNYLSGYFKYLNLVIELPIEKIETYRGKLEPIQQVRNKLVHGGSEISEDRVDSKDIRRIVEESSGLLKIEEDLYTSTSYLRIHDTAYVKNGFAIFEELVRNLFVMIDEKIGYKLLKEDLKILFQWYCRSIEISAIVVSKIKKGVEVKMSVSLIDNDAQPKTFNMSIQTTRSTEMSLEIINQHEDLQEFIDKLSKKKYFYSKQINRLLGLKSKNHKKITIH